MLIHMEKYSNSHCEIVFVRFHQWDSLLGEK